MRKKLLFIILLVLFYTLQCNRNLINKHDQTYLIMSNSSIIASTVSLKAAEDVYAISWCAFDSLINRNDCSMSLYGKTGELISEIRNLKGSFTDIEKAKIAVSDDGNFIVTYKAYLDASDYDYIVTRKYDKNSGRQLGELIFNLEKGNYLENIELNVSENLSSFYICTLENNITINIRKFSTSCFESGTKQLVDEKLVSVYSNMEADIDVISTEFFQNGNFVVAWFDKRSYKLMFSILNMDGENFVIEKVKNYVNKNNSFSVSFIKIGILSFDKFVLTTTTKDNSSFINEFFIYDTKQKIIIGNFTKSNALNHFDFHLSTEKNLKLFFGARNFYGGLDLMEQDIRIENGKFVEETSNPLFPNYQNFKYDIIRVIETNFEKWIMIFLSEEKGNINLRLFKESQTHPLCQNFTQTIYESPSSLEFRNHIANTFYNENNIGIIINQNSLNGVLQDEGESEIKINLRLANTKIKYDSKNEKADHFQYISVDVRGRKSSPCTVTIEKGCNSTCKSCTKLEKKKCKSCHSGKYLDYFTGTCIKCNENCEDCSSSNFCNKCSEGYIKKGGKCEKDFRFARISTDSNNLVRTTANCPASCKTCASFDDCSDCNEGYLLYLKECVKPCPDGYYLNSSKKCVVCDGSCINCIYIDSCTECVKDMYLYNGKCVSVCPNGFFANSTTKTCDQCGSNCKICSDSSTCIECNSNYVLDGTNCSTGCSSGRFLNLSTNKCDNCDSFCKTCSNKDNCSECNVGYLLDVNKCKDPCSKGYFLNSSKICQLCSTDCERCVFDDQCTLCKVDRFLLDSGCVAICPTGYFEINNTKCEKCKTNCKSCNSLTECDECEIGNYLLNSECLQECPENYFKNEVTRTCQECGSNCKKCTNSLICTTCKNSFYLNGNVCVSECPSEKYVNTNNECKECGSNCKSCIDSESCNICKDGYFLDSKTCVTQCSNGKFPNIINNLCEICESNCIECSNSTTCNTCQTSNFLQENDCVSTCSDGKYTDEYSTCQTCVSTCLKCNSADQCSECINDFFLFKDICRDTCPTGSFENISKKTCNLCEEGCIDCIDSRTCIECVSDMYLYNGKCRKICPDGFFSNTSTKSCEACGSNCKICSDSTKCIECDSDYILDGSSCFSLCLIGYFRNISTNKCDNCDSSCKNCISLDNCRECNDGYLLDVNICKDPCPLGYFLNSSKLCQLCNPECETCKYEDRCTKCKENKFVLETACLATCPAGYFVSNNTICEKCTANCKSCNILTECNECEIGFYLHNNLCLQECPENYFKNEVTKTCQNCSSNCKRCTDSLKCTECKYGFELNTINQCVCPQGSAIDSNGNSCESCSANCNTCSTPSLCSSCLSGYVLNNSICDPCPSNCEVCSSASSCITCKSGFELDSNKLCKCPVGYVINPRGNRCDGCPANCNNCSSPSKCTICKAGFEINVNYKCICPLGFFMNIAGNGCFACSENCLICSNSSSCTSCKAGFIKDSNNQCVCSSGFILNSNRNGCDACPDNCSACSSSSKCTNCKSGFFLNSDFSCNPCPDYCDSCSNTTTCSTCISGFNKNSNNECVCPQGFVVNVNLKICDPCPNNCQICSSASSCTTCNSGFRKNSSNRCVCPRGSIMNSNGNGCDACPGNCNFCTNSSTCAICNSGFFKDSNNLCACEQGSIINSTKDGCNSCPDNCNVCSNPITCTSCNEDFILDSNNKCICPTGFVLNSFGKWCDACPKNCNVCSDSSTCITCKTGFVLNFNKECVCPSGFVLNSNESVCDACSANCLQCSNTSTCLTCNSGFTLNNKVCIAPNCPNNFYFDFQTLRCESCPSNCKKCSSSSKCSECQTGFYLGLDQLCIKFTKSCPQNYFYYDATTDNCLRCLDNCKNCSNGKSCPTCEDDYEFDNKTIKCVIKGCINRCQNLSECAKSGDNLICICKKFTKGEFCELDDAPVIDIVSPVTPEVVEYIEFVDLRITTEPTAAISQEKIEIITQLAENQTELIKSGEVEPDEFSLRVFNVAISTNVINYNQGVTESLTKIATVKESLVSITEIIVRKFFKSNRILFGRNTQEDYIIFKFSRFSVQITSSTPEKISYMNEDSLNNELSIVEATECEAELKNKNGLGESENLIVLKINFYYFPDLITKDNDYSTSILFQYFHPKTQTIIDGEPCKNFPVTFKGPNTYLSTILIKSKYQDLKNVGVDIFDSNSDVFKSRCSSVVDPTTLKDATLSYRINNYFLNKSMNCADGCEYAGIDENYYVICNCRGISSKEIIINYISNSNIDVIVNDVNLEVLNCFVDAWKSPHIFNNPGFYIGLILILLSLVFLFLKGVTGIKLIENNLKEIINFDCSQFKDPGMFKDNIKGEKSSNQKQTKSEPKETKNYLKSEYASNKQEIPIPIKFPNYNQESIMKEVNKTQTKEIAKANIIEPKYILNPDDINFEILTNNQNTVTKIKNENNQGKINTKTKNNVKNMNVNTGNTIKDYYTMSPYIAITEDNRSFFTILFHNLIQEHVVFSWIFKRSLLNPIWIEIIFYCFRMNILFLLNAMLFFDSLIDQRIQYHPENEFVIVWTREFPKTILSLVGAILMTGIMSPLITVPRIIEEEFNTALQTMHKDVIKKKMKLRYTIFIVITFLINIFCWFYCISFNGVYKATSRGWVVGSFVGLLMLDWLILSILIPIFRTILMVLMRTRIFRFLVGIEYLFWITKELRR